MQETEPAAAHAFDEILEGQEETRLYQITPEVRSAFLAGFNDRSPLHIDLEFAKAAGYSRLIMHGSILNGFLSHFVGMVFPGRPAMLLSADLRYLQPCFLKDEIQLRVTVAQKNDTSRVLVLHVRFTRHGDDAIVASGRVMVMVRNV